MARTINKKSKRKVSQTPAQAMATRASNRARSIISSSASKLGFMGGMAYLDTQVLGLEDVMVNAVGSVDYKMRVVDAIQHQLRSRPRTWTLILGFIREKDDEIEVVTDSHIFNLTTPMELDKIANEYMFKASVDLWTDDTFCTIWMTIPDAVVDADTLIQRYDDILEECGAYDRDHINRISETRADVAALEASNKGDTRFKDTAVAIANALEENGYPIDIRLLRSGHTVTNLDVPTNEVSWMAVGASECIQVCANLDRYKWEEASDETKELIMQIADGFLVEFTAQEWDIKSGGMVLAEGVEKEFKILTDSIINEMAVEGYATQLKLVPNREIHVRVRVGGSWASWQVMGRVGGTLDTIELFPVHGTKVASTFALIVNTLLDRPLEPADAPMENTAMESSPSPWELAIAQSKLD